MEEFDRYYPLLFATARSLLGSCDEIEDVVQESYIRYATAAAQQIGSLRAYLLTIVTRLCLDRLKSARVQREQPLGLWPPAPGGGPTVAPEPEPEELVVESLEQREALAHALWLLQERLSPAERAVFLLHEAFACPYEEIARLLNRSASACRQLLHRARTRLRVAQARARFSVKPEEHRALLNSFLLAARGGPVQPLVETLLPAAEVPGTDVKAALIQEAAPVPAASEEEPLVLPALEECHVHA
ncbi:MAG: sigma-70 family RNA polymerase sigma factor [Thermogemmatispora sp.]|uniref:sigma-70 family RNA polymerase sigma factor n=1 Tax=Thermogemmatispora sp. TaxID=1968838 RepID=UPI0019FB8AF0|nr:sigma-70 family RNA polymerase sigma factor [Thermogemmatispora sp.]MBE3567806.1 sigma-70 family RNA polymerase sigma factor [Thermogemmatispora sp.]